MDFFRKFNLFALLILFVSTQIFFTQLCSKQTKIPIVYHDSYNISLFGLERLHPFDTNKYRNIRNYLIKTSDGKITRNSFYKPNKVSKEDLLLVHDKDYLKILSKPKTILEIIGFNELPLSFLLYGEFK